MSPNVQLIDPFARHHFSFKPGRKRELLRGFYKWARRNFREESRRLIRGEVDAEEFDPLEPYTSGWFF